MDLIIYCILIASIGFARFNTTKSVSDDVGIVQVGCVTSSCELPVASNLAMIKEPDAYTLILEELGL